MIAPSAITRYYFGVARWEEDPVGRLQFAAMSLFLERGYSEVTVAEIAERAGLTKRTFFNHFSDKREVLFAGSKDFIESTRKHLSEANPELSPIDAAIYALTQSGVELEQHGEYAQARRDLIAKSTELQERDLIKMSAVTKMIADALDERGVEPKMARLTAEAVIAIFNSSYDEWIDTPGSNLGNIMQRQLEKFRAAIA